VRVTVDRVADSFRARFKILSPLCNDSAFRDELFGLPAPARDVLFDRLWNTIIRRISIATAMTPRRAVFPSEKSILTEQS